ncbi:MAG: restriction endonuclease subunit S [Fluviicola sp.]|nr:restriction endonuclease subunit S [Fluviicola sp.]MBP6074251.1 restriction endonuclease subunit S [Flavobacterium sp.]
MPKNWKSYKLTELGTIARGKSKHRPRDAAHLYGGKYPFIQTGDVKAANHRLNNHSQTYSEDGLAQSKLWPKDTMCITIAANIAETTILNYPACFPDSIIGFIADEEKCDIDFIEYLMQFFRKQIQSHSIGSVQDNINLATFERINFLVPPLPEQTAIASILSALDDKIELNLQMNKTLEEMAMALYKHWFVDFGPFKDGEFVESELGMIPKGWEVKKFDCFIEKIIDNRGKTPPLSVIKTKYLLFETYQLNREKLFPDNFKENKAKYVTEEIFKNPKWFRKGHPEFMDILFATVGSIPNWALMYENDGVGVAQNIVGIRTKSNIPSIFLRCSFESKSFLEQFERYVIRTAQPSIKLSDLNRIDIIAPPENVIQSWHINVAPLVQEVYSFYKENQSLKSVRDTLLSKLISGEIRVKDLEKN